MDVNTREELSLAYKSMESTVIAALREFVDRDKETPLDAAEHLQAIIIGAVTKKAEYASIYDYALVTPKLFRDLTSRMGHDELARKWNLTEQSVRRTRKQMQAKGIDIATPRLYPSDPLGRACTT
jgi:hypothetical protein